MRSRARRSANVKPSGPHAVGSSATTPEPSSGSGAKRLGFRDGFFFWEELGEGDVLFRLSFGAAVEAVAVVASDTDDVAVVTIRLDEDDDFDLDLALFTEDSPDDDLDFDAFVGAATNLVASARRMDLAPSSLPARIGEVGAESDLVSLGALFLPDLSTAEYGAAFSLSFNETDVEMVRRVEVTVVGGWAVDC